MQRQQIIFLVQSNLESNPKLHFVGLLLFLQCNSHIIGFL